MKKKTKFLLSSILLILAITATAIYVLSNQNNDIILQSSDADVDVFQGFQNGG